METVNVDALVVVPQETMGNVCNVGSYNQRVDEILIKVDQLEQNLNEVEQFYTSANKKKLSTPKGGSILKDKDSQKLFASFKKRKQDAASRESAAGKSMQELMCQFGTILHQITQHEWAGPFMQPVDVVGLGLHDYYEVIGKPMDFSTIKSKMKAKDGNGYKNVREIYADVRLIFKNAMKYNKERHHIHVMAKTLLEKFETEWLQLLPKVDEEEKRQKEEEAEMQLDMKLAQDAAHAKMAKDLSIELDKVEMHLEELKDMVLQNCRRMSTEEKRRLSSAIARLSPEDIDKAVEIVAQSNPDFQAAREDVEINMDVQSESTLWKLKFFIKDALHDSKNSPNISEDNQNNDNKRKREICDTLAKTSKKRGKKFPG